MLVGNGQASLPQYRIKYQWYRSGDPEFDAMQEKLLALGEELSKLAPMSEREIAGAKRAADETSAPK